MVLVPRQDTDMSPMRAQHGKMLRVGMSLHSQRPLFGNDRFSNGVPKLEFPRGTSVLMLMAAWSSPVVDL